MPQSGAVIVLGSGLAEDIPLEALAARSERLSSSILFISRLSGAVSPPIPGSIRKSASRRSISLASSKSCSRASSAIPVVGSAGSVESRARSRACHLCNVPVATAARGPALAPGRMSARKTRSHRQGCGRTPPVRSSGLCLPPDLADGYCVHRDRCHARLLGQHDLLHGVVCRRVSGMGLGCCARGEVSGGISYRHRVGGFIGRAKIKNILNAPFMLQTGMLAREAVKGGRRRRFRSFWRQP